MDADKQLRRADHLLSKACMELENIDPDKLTSVEAVREFNITVERFRQGCIRLNSAGEKQSTFSA